MRRVSRTRLRGSVAVGLTVATVRALNRRLDETRAVGLRQGVAVMACVRGDDQPHRRRLMLGSVQVLRHCLPDQYPQFLFVHHVPAIGS